ncbi:MAG: hypothetical protein ABWZ98_04235 [Nakamurella sp.]
MFRDQCGALLLTTPPHAFFSHLTAAQLWPLPLPTLDPAEPLHVSVRPPEREPRRLGVTGHLVTDASARIVLRYGLPVVDPATLFCQLGTMLPLEDLVAIGDALVLRPVVEHPWGERPWVPLRQLAERVAIFRGRGKQVAQQAVRLIRPGAESRPETLLRLAIVAAGLPEPEVNVEIFDARGRFIGRADLVYRHWRVIVEYDGDHHRTSTKQFDKDVLRLEAFDRAGWDVTRIVGRSFFGDRAACILRVRDALTSAGWAG